MMGSRAVHTVIFLGVQRTDRVDLGRAPAYPVVAQHHQISNGTEDPVRRLETALEASPKPGKLVWILWEGAAAQMLDLPSGVVDGLEREQLAHTLSFEAEPLSGIPAAKSAIDGIPHRNPASALPDFRRYWVTQLSSSIVGRLQETVAATGSRLAGIAHPGGLPRESWDVDVTDNRQDWRRIEIWDQLTFALQGRADGSVETRIMRAPPGTDSWTSELPTDGSLSWLGPGPATRVGPDGRRISDILPHDDDGAPLEPTKIEFPPDSAPVEWLRGWVSELTSQPRRVPAVYSHSQVSPNRRFYASGGLAAALALALIAGHATWLSMRTADLKAKADHQAELRLRMTPKDESPKEIAKLTQETEPYKAQLAELDARLATLKTEEDRRAKLMAKVQAQRASGAEFQKIHRPALAELLKAIAESEQYDRTTDLVIKDVRKQDTGELIISGVCRKPRFADAIAMRLENRLSGAGWKVGAAQKRHRHDSDAFNYSIILTPAVLSDNPEPPTTRPTSRPAPTPTPQFRVPQTTTASLTGSRP